ncbi:MAG: helix-turn-helix domain-containing protein [Capsulimonadales bacterium]|nr:helix-turn-helix domain-containing protein [Capsulimonadales bacterium]
MTSSRDERFETSEADHLFCPFNATLDLLTGRWTLHILQTLMSGPKRFNEIAQINDINPHTLRKRLGDLETQGVVTRTVVRAMPPNVEYGLTEKGYALNRVFEEIAAWGRTYMEPPADRS